MTGTVQFDPMSAFEYAVGLGLIQGMSVRNVYGFIANTPTTQHGDVTPFTSTYVWPNDAGQTMEIVSSNPADVGIVITVVGLDETWDDKVQNVTLNGTTPVALTGLWSRINYVFHASLADVEFTGNVDVRATGGGAIFARALPAGQESGQTVFSVGRRKSWMVKGLVGTIRKSTGSAGSNIEALFTFRYRGGVFRHPFAFGLQRDGQSSIAFNNFIPERLNAPADIIIQAQASDADIGFGARYQVLMVNTGEPT